MPEVPGLLNSNFFRTSTSHILEIVFSISHHLENVPHDVKYESSLSRLTSI